MTELLLPLFMAFYFMKAEGGFGEVDTDIILKVQNSSSLTLIVLAHHSCHYGLIGAHCQKSVSGEQPRSVGMNLNVSKAL